MAKLEPMKPRPPVIRTRAPLNARPIVSGSTRYLLRPLVDRLSNNLDLVGPQSHVHRQRQDFARDRLSYGQRTGAIAQVLISGLSMNGHRIVNQRIDPMSSQAFLQSVAMGMTNHVQVINVANRDIGAVLAGQFDATQELPVRRSEPAPFRIMLVQMRKFDAEDCSLQLIESAVDATVEVMIARGLAIVAQSPQALR